MVAGPWPGCWGILSARWPATTPAWPAHGRAVSVAWPAIVAGPWPGARQGLEWVGRPLPGHCPGLAGPHGWPLTCLQRLDFEDHLFKGSFFYLGHLSIKKKEA